jgi:hypothetical protein
MRVPTGSSKEWMVSCKTGMCIAKDPSLARRANARENPEFHFRRPHGVGVPDAEKTNGALRPADIALLRPIGEVLGPRQLPNLIQELHGSSPYGNFPGHDVLHRRRAPFAQQPLRPSNLKCTYMYKM